MKPFNKPNMNVEKPKASFAYVLSKRKKSANEPKLYFPPNSGSLRKIAKSFSFPIYAGLRLNFRNERLDFVNDDSFKLKSCTSEIQI